MTGTRVVAATLCAFTLAAHGVAAKAAPDRKERGPSTVTPGTKDGKSGVWVEYHVYTLRDYSAQLDDLLSWNGRAISLNGVPTSKSTSGSSYDNKVVEFGHKIDFGAINAVLGNPGYVGQHGNKKNWIDSYATQTASGFKIKDMGCTASSLLEASRLARIYQLLELGVEPTQATMSGHYVAYYSDHPYSIALTRDAVLKKLKEVFAHAIDTYSPIVLDLNHDGRIGVTGKSTAAVRKPQNGYVAAGSVQFDLRGLGEKKRYEWLSGDGDGFLVHDVDGRVTLAARSGSEVDGNVLFGNAVGYDHGFQKLALFTGGVHTAAAHMMGPVPDRVFTRTSAKGDDLEHLKVWIDANRDARPQPAELHSLKSLGITEIGLRPRFNTNAAGETVIQSWFIQNGKRYLSEDVWFAEEPAAGADAPVRK